MKKNPYVGKSSKTTVGYKKQESELKLRAICEKDIVVSD
jgi:hypothetical protein